jgi:hypothetical protein
VESVPDPRYLRKFGSAGNRTRDLWICSQQILTTRPHSLNKVSCFSVELSTMVLICAYGINQINQRQTSQGGNKGTADFREGRSIEYAGDLPKVPRTSLCRGIITEGQATESKVCQTIFEPGNKNCLTLCRSGGPIYPPGFA